MAEYKYTSLEAFTDSLVQNAIGQDRLAGGEVLLYKAGDTLLHKTYGKANIELNVPMPKNAVYEIGSITKQITAVAILKLVGENKIGLDDDITKYLDFNTRGHKITVRQLLDHTSGIKSYTSIPSFFEFAAERHSRDSLLNLIKNYELEFEPGEKWEYNNSGYFLAGLIIEEVSGVSYENYITQNIFKPLGMSDSYFCSSTFINPCKTSGYDYNTQLKKLVLPQIIHQNWSYSAGSICSTTKDILIWLKNIHNGSFINSELYDAFITPTVLNDGTPKEYGLGIYNEMVDNIQILTHEGLNPGYCTMTSYYPEKDLYLIIFLNSGGPFNDYTFDKEFREFLFATDN